MPLYQVDIPEVTIISMLVWADDPETAERVGLHRWLQDGQAATGFEGKEYGDHETPTSHEVDPENYPPGDVRECFATPEEIEACREYHW